MTTYADYSAKIIRRVVCSNCAKSLKCSLQLLLDEPESLCPSCAATSVQRAKHKKDNLGLFKAREADMAMLLCLASLGLATEIKAHKRSRIRLHG